MIAKWKVNLLLALSTFTLVGVGFSSWVISAGSVFESENVIVGVDSIVNSNSAIVYDATKATETIDKVYPNYVNRTGIVLMYNENGFYFDESFTTSTAVINSFFKLNITECKNNDIYQDGADVIFAITFSCIGNGDGVEYIDLAKEANNGSFEYRHYNQETEYKAVSTTYAANGLTANFTVSDYSELVYEGTDGNEYLNFETKFIVNTSNISSYFSSDYATQIQAKMSNTIIVMTTNVYF